MDSVFESLLRLANLNAMPGLALSFGLLILLGILLAVGRRLDAALQLERLGIPVALLVGLLALLLGPYGPIALLSESVTDIWVKLPTPLLTLIFGSLMIGRPLPRGEGLFQPVASQALLGLFLGFGQYLVGGLVVLFLLIPYWGVDPLMGCLLEVGFEGGHGAAVIMGDSFSNLGFPGGLDLGLAIATVGLLSSTLLGSGLVVFARFRGWLASSESPKVFETSEEVYVSGGFSEVLRSLLVNLGLIGFAVLFGIGTLAGLRLLAPFIGGLFNEVMLVFPVFPLALLGSLLIRLILEKTKKTNFVSELLQREIETLATDLLIVTAIASLNLPLLKEDWLPLAVLSFSGLIWNLSGMFVFARFIFSEEWFERSITEFGNATGVAASGLLLLRLADPLNITRTLPVFSLKQLFLQPLLSGGVITVIAPLVVNQLGLKGWTEICGTLTILFIGIGFFLKKGYAQNPT